MIIAIIAGFLAMGASFFLGWQNLVSYLMSLVYTSKNTAMVMPVAVGLIGLPGILVATVIMAGDTWRRGKSETRSRKCEYILRGLREPVCPECGERI